jgi:hypothetical protein
MRLVVRLLGLDLLDVELTTEPGCDGLEDDHARDLSGGNLGSYPIDAGPTDRYMGFTSGLEYEDE